MSGRAAPPSPSSQAGEPTFDCRNAFVEELVLLAREDERVLVVCNDSVGSSNLKPFLTEFPDRLVNVGIAEQDMVGVAAGLANGGFVPFVCAASPFLTGRALEQIKVDVAYSQYHVVLCGMSPGVAYGELGPTHHSIEDLAWLRALTGLTVVVPADPRETRAAVRWAASISRPSFIRVSRFKVPNVTPEGEPFREGRAALLRDGKDVTIVTAGILVSRALEAAKDLAAKGVEARVLNMATIAPIDVEAIVRAARETGRVVTAEEAVVRGGLGSAVAEVLCEKHPVPMRILGFPGFCPSGSTGFLLDHFGLSAAGIARAALDLVG
jgi:transketolase